MGHYYLTSTIWVIDLNDVKLNKSYKVNINSSRTMYQNSRLYIQDDTLYFISPDFVHLIDLQTGHVKQSRF